MVPLTIVIPRFSSICGKVRNSFDCICETFTQGQELVKAKDEIIDLNEKLDTLKLKRAKDQDKIKEYEKVRIQCEQLVEFKVVFSY